MLPAIMLNMTSGEAARRRRLGETVRMLRRRQRLTVEAAAARAGMSSTTWQRVEDGLTVRSLTYRGAEEVLGLEGGVLDELLAGTAAWSEVEDSGRGEEKTITVRGLTDEQARAIKNFASTLVRLERERRNSA